MAIEASLFYVITKAEVTDTAHVCPTDRNYGVA